MADLGLTKAEMLQLFAASMWANSGAIKKKGAMITEEEKGPDSHDRTRAGFMAKRIINIGRLLYMKAKGYQVSIKKYCALESSPENLIIICKHA